MYKAQLQSTNKRQLNQFCNIQSEQKKQQNWCQAIQKAKIVLSMSLTLVFKSHITRASYILLNKSYNISKAAPTLQ